MSYKGGLDLSKEALWVSVGQRAADLRGVKVGGQKEILPIGPVRTCYIRAGLIGPVQTHYIRAGPIGRIFFQISNFDDW